VGEDRRRRGGRTSPIRVVIAEDEPDVRAALRALLEDEADLTMVGEAADGVEAICATLRLRPDVLLLDLRMPVMDGLHAAHVLRRIAPQMQIVVLTCTGPAHAPELLRLDVHGYLCKPVQGPELADAIRTVHGGGVCLAPNIARRLAAGDAPAAHGGGPTPRELEVLRLVVEGLGNRQIAARLGICERTVECHISRLFAKFGADSRARLSRLALQQGWVA
jgi:DNA-binding NarL/FixJ family response regulator